MNLLGSAKKVIDKDKDGEDVRKLGSADVVLMHCNNQRLTYLTYCLFLYLIYNLVN